MFIVLLIKKNSRIVCLNCLHRTVSIKAPDIVVESINSSVIMVGISTDVH